MLKSEQINELATALALAQGEMQAAEKDGTNPHFRSSYATLASVWESIRLPLSAHGLSIVQSPGSTEGGMMHITTILLHKSGQYIEDIFQIPAGAMTPQGMGSAITYARRYTLMAICGIAADDDDGNEATAQASSKPAQQTGRQGNWRDDNKAAQAATTAAAKSQETTNTSEPLSIYHSTDPINTAHIELLVKNCKVRNIEVPDMTGWTKSHGTAFFNQYLKAKPEEPVETAKVVMIFPDQIETIRFLSKELGANPPAKLLELTNEEASVMIDKARAKLAAKELKAA